MDAMVLQTFEMPEWGHTSTMASSTVGNMQYNVNSAGAAPAFAGTVSVLPQEMGVSTFSMDAQTSYGVDSSIDSMRFLEIPSRWGNSEMGLGP